ncbi:uncharacterized protein LOC136763510 [Amia ocellicauda]|uniref:uncharacterized protein LOC136763510 n=1 Tax=Amia ocellicauda TaxID=2972642 RepID=UPI0034647F57
MGSSLGCVKQQREVGSGVAPPLSPKKRLRFKRKRKAKKIESDVTGTGRDGETRREWGEGTVGREHDREKDGDGVVFLGELNEMAKRRLDEEGAAAPEEDSEVVTETDTSLPVLKKLRPYAQSYPDSNPDHAASAGPGGLLGVQGPQQQEEEEEREEEEEEEEAVPSVHRVVLLSPEPSPVWSGGLYRPESESEGSFGVSNGIQTSSERNGRSSSSTPGGGRVYRVRERLQGVLERPWLIQSETEGYEAEEEEEEEDSLSFSSEVESRSVVRIREVGGRLCVVRTVYPSLGAQLWGDEEEGAAAGGGVEVRRQAPQLSQERGEVLRVRLSEERGEGHPEGNLHPECDSQLRVQISPFICHSFLLLGVVVEE